MKARVLLGFSNNNQMTRRPYPSPEGRVAKGASTEPGGASGFERRKSAPWAVICFQHEPHPVLRSAKNHPSLAGRETPPGCSLARATGEGSSEHPLLAQRRDLVPLVAELAENLVGVLAEHRRAVADRAGRFREKHRRFGDRRGLRSPGKFRRLKKSHGGDLRVLERLLRPEYRAGRDLGLAENLQHLG